jgi:O-antigen/teichoic acid export membrane protein
MIFTISSFASKLLGFLMLPLYTRVLSREEFGTADLIIFSIGLILPLLTISISESIIRFAIDENENKKHVFSIGLKTIIIGCFILLFMIPLASKIPVIKDYTVWFYLIYISQSLNSYFNSFTRGLNKIKLIGIVGVIQTLTVVFSNIMFLVVFELGVDGFLFSIVLGNVVALLVLFFGANLKHYLVFIKTDKQLTKEIVKYSIPLVPARTSWWFNNSSNRYIIANFSGISELGLFAAASKIPSILITFQGIFIQAWELSALTEYKKEDGAAFFTKIYNLYNFALVIGCSFLIMFLKPISGTLLGPEFKEAWRLVPFLLIAVIFGGIIGFLNTINMAEKKTNALVIPVIIGASVGVTINFIFVPKYGAMVASVSVTISYFLIWLMRLIDTQKYMRLKISYLNDSISYLLVVLQAIIILTFDMPQAIFYSGLCTVLIIIFNYKTLMSLVKFTSKKIIQIINYSK